MVRPMVHSTKHYVQNSIATVLAGARTNLVIAQAVAVVDKNVAFEVEEGATIKAVFFEQWVRASEVSPGSYVATIEKIVSGGTFPSTTSMAALNDYANKKNVFFSSQGLVNDQDADAMSVIRGWIKIPKSKQRFGLGDSLLFSLFAQGAIDMVLCGLTTYKEYT